MLSEFISVYCQSPAERSAISKSRKSGRQAKADDWVYVDYDYVQNLNMYIFYIYMYIYIIYIYTYWLNLYTGQHVEMVWYGMIWGIVGYECVIQIHIHSRPFGRKPLQNGLNWRISQQPFVPWSLCPSSLPKIDQLALAPKAQSAMKEISELYTYWPLNHL